MTEEILVLKQGVPKRKQEHTRKPKIELSEKEVEAKEARVVIGIPTYRSESLVESTIKRLRGSADAIYVCGDETNDPRSLKAEFTDCTLIPQPTNQGYFSSIRSLMKAALNSNADILVVVDPGSRCGRTDIETVARLIAFETYDIVIGTSEEEQESDARSGYQGRTLLPKAYSKKAMLQLLEDAYNQESRTKAKVGLRIRRCPLPPYTNAGESDGNQDEIESIVTIRIPKRGARFAKKSVARAKIFVGSFAFFLQVKIPRMIKSFSSSNIARPENRRGKKQANEQLQVGLPKSINENRTGKLGRFLRFFFSKIKRGMMAWTQRGHSEGIVS